MQDQSKLKKKVLLIIKSRPLRALLLKSAKYSVASRHPAAGDADGVIDGVAEAFEIAARQNQTDFARILGVAAEEAADVPRPGMSKEKP